MKPAKRNVSRETLPSRDPWSPIVPTQREANAVKALASGNANALQQGEVMSFIFRLAGVADLEFRPDSDRATAFASGKRFVGMQFAKTMNLTSETIKTLPEKLG